MTNILFINGVDAWTQWGVVFEDGSYERLLRGAPFKDAIENKSSQKNGKDVILTGRKMDERDVQLTFCFKKGSDFLTRYASFLSTVQAGKIVGSETYPLELGAKELGVVYKLVYSDCLEMVGLGLVAGKISIKFNEPNPANRGTI